MFLDDEETELGDGSRAEELNGRTGSDPDEERLAHSVMENDEQIVRDGKLLAESVDYAVGSFTPDLFFEELARNYRNAQRLYGPTIIRELTGFEPGYVERNIKMRDFQEEVKQHINQSIDRFQREGLLDDEGKLTDQGLLLAALVLYTEELAHLDTRGVGPHAKRRAHYGERDDLVPFRGQRYKDLDVRASIRRAVRRGRRALRTEDLIARARVERGGISVVYALDVSGSMRGTKLRMAKRAGVALAYKAIRDGNRAGIVLFTSRIQESLAPGRDFPLLLRTLAAARARQETDIALAIMRATELFSRGESTRHLVLITDALPTRGKEPGRTTMDAVAGARDAGVTISLIGIGLEKEGEKLAKRIVELGEGRLYRVANLEHLDLVVLEDYEAVRGT